MPAKNAAKKFKFLEDIAIADIAFEAYGDSLEELFENSAIATVSVVASPSKIASKVKKTLQFTAPAKEKLLFDFLSELIYLKDAEGLIFGKFSCKITGAGKNGLKLTVKAEGEPIAQERHSSGHDIKAVTYHLFEIAEEQGKWKSRVILDI